MPIKTLPFSHSETQTPNFLEMGSGIADVIVLINALDRAITDDIVSYTLANEKRISIFEEFRIFI